MGTDRDHLTLLERLDLALASRLALRGCDVDLARPEDLRDGAAPPDLAADGRWITRVLGLRGLELHPDEATAILRNGLEVPVRADQETRLMSGLAVVLARIRERAAAGQAPDGWFAVELFRCLTDGVARFRKNSIRRDEPWDAVAGVLYPDPRELPARLEEFCEARHYGDSDEAFAALHPVRRAVRLLWGFARIAPFPDFNVVMAFVLMDAYLLTRGYPMLTPEPDDRDLLARVVAGPRPPRVVQFESRLVADLGA